MLVGPGFMLVVLFTFVKNSYFFKGLFQNSLFWNEFYTEYHNQNLHELAFSLRSKLEIELSWFCATYSDRLNCPGLVLRCPGLVRSKCICKGY
jgi:hypothetical protein